MCRPFHPNKEMNEHYVDPYPQPFSAFGLADAVRKPDTKLHHEIQCSFSPASEVRCRELLTVGLRGGMSVCDYRVAQVAIQTDNAEAVANRERCTHM